MPATKPEDICRLFKQYVAEGDLDGLISLSDAEAAFLSESRVVHVGQREIREQLAPLAAAKAAFEFDIRQIVRAGDVALMHTLWRVSMPHPRSVYAIEVARRQADRSWRWLIGDPFTVGRNFVSA